MSSSRRPVILMAILLALLSAACFLRIPEINPKPAVESPLAGPLAGTNSISNLVVKQNDVGEWIADFDYFWVGSQGLPFFRLELRSDSELAPLMGIGLASPRRGAHHVSAPIPYPGSQQTSQHVAVVMEMMGRRLASQQVDQVIDWPNPQTWLIREQLAKGTPEETLTKAIALVDSDGEYQLAEAKQMLEGLLHRNPQLEQPYIELARVAMKSNWGPEGLHQAETLLASALQIQPDSVNAKILLGYVYTHQNNYSKAQQLFAEAARSNPPNLWLWANWGELLTMQRKYDEAIAKYRDAIARPVTHDTNDRARKDAYRSLLALLGRRKDLDGMEALYKQQVADYGPGSCYSSDYARFLLEVRGDTQAAIDLARRALNQDCEDSAARRVLGLAEYVQWATTSGTERAESLNQARIYLPPGASSLYMLATSDRTSVAIKQLLATGEHIDQQDNARQTALSYALQNNDLEAARRLLKLRARPDTPVGHEGIPIALVPVLQGDSQAIHLMREFGVNYSKMRFRGATAFDFAKQTGNLQVLESLGRDEAAL